MSKSKIFLVDLTTVTSAFSSRADEDFEPVTKKAKTDQDICQNVDPAGDGDKSAEKPYEQSTTVMSRVLFTAETNMMTIFSAAFTSTRFYFLADVTDTSLTCHYCENDDVVHVLNGATRQVKWETTKLSYSSELNMDHSFTADIVCVHYQTD